MIRSSIEIQHTADTALTDLGMATALSSARAPSAVYVLMTVAKAEMKDLLQRRTCDTRNDSIKE